MALGDIYEVRVAGWQGEGHWVNRLHFREILAETGAIPAQHLADACFNQFANLWRDLLSNRAGLSTISARRTVPGPAATGIRVGIGSGSIDFPMASPDDTLIIRWVTHRDLPVHWNRISLGGFPKTEVGYGRLKSSLYVLANSLAEAIMTQFQSELPGVGRWDHIIVDAEGQPVGSSAAYRVTSNLGRMKTRRAKPGFSGLID